MSCEGDVCTIDQSNQVERVVETDQPEQVPVISWADLSPEEKLEKGKELASKLEITNLHYFEPQTIQKKDGSLQTVPVEKSVQYIPNVPYLILYFTASWCPPCKKFSPHLQEFVNDNKDDVDVIVVTVDKEQYDFINVVKNYNFKYVHHEEQALIKYLSQRLNVQVLPTCIVINVANCSVLTKWGREAIANNPNTCIQEWKDNRHGFQSTDVLKFW